MAPAVFTWDLNFLLLPIPYATSLPWDSCWLMTVRLKVSWEVVSVALGLCSPACGSHLGDLTWGCAGQMAWLGATDQTGIWMCPSAFFLILHGPAGLSPACCHTLCVLDGFSVFCPAHFPQEGTPSSVSVGLSLRDRLPEKLSLSSLADAFL